MIFQITKFIWILNRLIAPHFDFLFFLMEIHFDKLTRMENNRGVISSRLRSADFIIGLSFDGSRVRSKKCKRCKVLASPPWHDVICAFISDTGDSKFSVIVLPWKSPVSATTVVRSFSWLRELIIFVFFDCDSLMIAVRIYARTERIQFRVLTHASAPLRTVTFGIMGKIRRTSVPPARTRRRLRTDHVSVPQKLERKYGKRCENAVLRKTFIKIYLD